ncbi:MULTISPECIES: DUF4838 domain-containing protein [unclassified Imperialibacter]|uniref:DUF4838 domain-containing protein n=1 Tax=unclassified Imperialibacter TaxID=2629706 RepID=UPI0012531357|nr:MULTISPECIES: DUF4838 domain-containing protein [unclassified Imperialibacter]CAD5254307.1 conserved hypothetical protein [Imperialibacter sp. 89]CAD5267238.1 conserved hypothetical protein [Imperialibacter sp. 75]VVT00787.1 conserved hypothetical protein [Imperialibacter sp. EC-SDR9]
MVLRIFTCLIAVFLIGGRFSPLLAQKKSKSKRENNSPEKIILADKGQTLYRIVVPSAATIDEQKAASVLQDYLLQISGAVLPIIEADRSRSRYEIVLGQNERLGELGINVNLNELGEDGFLIRTDSARLFITGGNEKGTLYGVYTFLENYLGCRMYSPKVKVVPKQATIVLDKIDDKQVPVIGFRDTHYRVTWDAEYIDWHKLDHNAKGGRPDWGMWVHTFNELVPPDVYYDEHPEYFAMVNGKRLPTQLCLTNHEVLDIAIQNLRRKIAENPDAKYWSVSQNDNRNFCTCDNCRAIDDREGSPSGSIIQFVNQVADQFPEKMISTLAYEYGRAAPKTLIPRDNVNIMLCSIEAFRDKPIETDTTSADFVKDVEDWGKIAKDIIVWDYVIQFNHLISPFPNLHTLKPNIQFFARNGVNALFEQGNREVGGEFAALRAYLISKLMWNPDEDVDALMNDFLQGVYGPASKPIRSYIDEMKEAMLASGQPLRIFGSPNEASTSYLSPELMKRYEQLFNAAELAVADSAQLLERVRIARLPLEYAWMEQAKKKFAGEGGVFQKFGDRWEASTVFRSKVDDFTDLCIREGVTQVKEWSTSPDEYRTANYRLLAQGMNEHLAYGKKVTFISPPNDHIAGEHATMLTDGIRGSQDYTYNWFSFSGQDLEVVIDLEELQPVRRIESAYFQYGFWLRLFPKKVEYSLSADGENYTIVSTVNNTLPIDQYGGQQRDFIGEFAPQNARYVKVKAYSIGNTPGWHPGAGRPANMLIDEIVVE